MLTCGDDVGKRRFGQGRLCDSSLSVAAASAAMGYNVSTNQPMDEQPTLFDIAGQLGISKMTVSRALRGERHVGDEMRLKVCRMAQFPLIK